MFALTKEPQALSPLCMRFQNFWIYDLRSLHSFWIQKIRSQKNLITGQRLVEVIMRAYHLHLFSPLDQITSLARDYHSQVYHPSSQNKLAEKAAIEKVLKHFRRLGVTRIGHLRKIPSAQIQKRFGEKWRFFFESISNPIAPDWHWVSFHESPPLKAEIEVDYILSNSQELYPLLEEQIQKWSQEYSSLFLQSLKIHIFCFESEGDQIIELLFSNHPSLNSQKSWILKMISLRLETLSLCSPVSRIQMQLIPEDRLKTIQLSLFEDFQFQIKWKETCDRLKAMGFEVFEPLSTTDARPEYSWMRAPVGQAAVLQGPIHFRPLVQFYPQPIPAPQGQLTFVERLEIFTPEGEPEIRDYFMTRRSRSWEWIFQNQNQEWFRQGIIE